jgi:hypothetical protein
VRRVGSSLCVPPRVTGVSAGCNGDDDGRRVYMRAMALEIGRSAAVWKSADELPVPRAWSGISKFDVPRGLELGVESSNEAKRRGTGGEGPGGDIPESGRRGLGAVPRKRRQYTHARCRASALGATEVPSESAAPQRRAADRRFGCY